MKKISMLLMSLCLMVAFAACSNGDSTPSETEIGATAEADGAGILIAYFTMPEDVDTSGVNAVAGASIVVNDGEVLGNTEYMASIIQDTIGGDLFQIETVQQYPLDHDPLVDQAAEEQDAESRPELSAHLDNLEQYDTIILGYPNWWGDMPMAIYTFLDTYDLSGKTIAPFITHGGSGLSGTPENIQEEELNASVTEGLAIDGDEASDSSEDVVEWLNSLGF